MTPEIVRVYNREKTICDAVRFRNSLGLDIAMEGSIRGSVDAKVVTH